MNSTSLPGKWNLNEFTGIPTWNNWDKSIRQSETITQLEEKFRKTKSICAPIKWLLLSYILFMLFGSGLGFFEFVRRTIFSSIIIFALSERGLVLGPIQSHIDRENAIFNSLWLEYSDMFIQPIANALTIDNWRSFRNGSEVLIYSDKKAAYFNTHNELLVAYSAENIKDVYKERLHTGAQTTGSSSTVGGATRVGDTNVTIGGAQTSSNAQTTNFYEWHFDIYTNFTAHPKVSLILDDSPNVEEFIGTAYAVLKP